MNCAVIIPALNPAHTLVGYVKNLLAAGIAQIIVVNDGSDESTAAIFSNLDNLENCTVLHHMSNKGKGRALKTAYTYLLQHYSDLDGAITADADGQHSVEDVCKMVHALANNQTILLGVRDFDHTNVPTKSLIGNKFTSLVFQLLFRHKLEDTQTGLRGIPTAELSWMLELKGERYEYEMNVLIHIVKRKKAIQTINIETIYFEKNAESYYRPLIDSAKILAKLVTGFFQKKTEMVNQYEE